MAELPEGAAAPDASGAAEVRLVVRTALSRLTARQRTVLVLRYFEDLPEAEVARLLGCSVGTVRSTTHRSLARLRTLAPELTAEGGTGRDLPEAGAPEAHTATSPGPDGARRQPSRDFSPVEVRP